MVGESAINSQSVGGEKPRALRAPSRGDGADDGRAAADAARSKTAGARSESRPDPVAAKAAAPDSRRGRELRPDDAGAGPPGPKVKFQPPDTESPGAPVFQREGDPPVPAGPPIETLDPPEREPSDERPITYDANGRPPQTERVGEQVDVLA